MLLALIAATTFWAQVGNPIVTPPNNSTTTTIIENNVTVQAPPPDPEFVAESSQQSVQAIVVNLVTPTLAKWANDALDIADIWRETPPAWSYDNRDVREMAELIRNVALGLVSLMLFAGACGHALNQGSQYGRLVYAALLSSGNLIWWEIGIRLNNAICAAIAAPSLRDIARDHLKAPSLTESPVDAFGPSVLVIVYAVVILLLLMSLAFRLGLIDILIVGGSLALLTKGLEQTDSFASRYQSLAVGTLFSQIAIVVCLRLAPVLGGLGTGVVGTFLGIVVLLLARKMPALLTSGQAERSGTGLLRSVLVVRRIFGR